jgi:hypothetical protein
VIIAAAGIASEIFWQDCKMPMLFFVCVGQIAIVFGGSCTVDLFVGAPANRRVWQPMPSSDPTALLRRRPQQITATIPGWLLQQLQILGDAGQRAADSKGMRRGAGA